jgi:SAM-dependent methyltransferase
MTMTNDPAAGDVDAFAERIFGAILGAQLTQAIDLGDRLGWYRALADEGPATAGELAARTGSAARYAREWLEHQAACGILTVDDAGAPPDERRFALPAAHAAVLADRDSVAFMTPIARFITASGQAIDHIGDAYRSGDGVSWAELGDEAREAQAAANRPLFLHRLAQELLPQAPAVDAWLQRASRVADVGCGYGWSSVALARAYPGVTVDGYDVDEPSLVAARRIADEAGVADRVTFASDDVAGLGDDRVGYDAVFAFECVHDMSDPVTVLAGMRRMVAPDGVVVVMDERTEDAFTAPAPEVERLLYGYSLMCCLGDGLSHQPSVGTGTVMRTDTFTSYALAAGFTGVEVLPIEDDFFRFYLLRH